MAVLHLPFLGLLAWHVCLAIAIPQASSVPAISSSTIVPSPSYSGVPKSPVLVGNAGPRAQLSFAANLGACLPLLQGIITQEFQYALDAIEFARQNIDSEYFDAFFSAESRSDPTFKTRIQTVLGRASQVLQGQGGSYGDNGKIRVTCDFTKPICARGALATMQDEPTWADRGWIMNFCPNAFTFKEVFQTNVIETFCSGQQHTVDLLRASLTIAMVIVHEITHIGFVGLDFQPTRDYAYGIADSLRLAAGAFNRACNPSLYVPVDGQPLCPASPGSSQEGVCDRTFAERNADTYRLLVAGVYFSAKCGYPIPIPRLNKRSTEELDPRQQWPVTAPCPVSDNPLAIDEGPGGSGVSITGYARFGDSYASGMGAGTTSSDSCRVGSNNYGNLIVQQLNIQDLAYEELSCSGDTLDGLNQQIDKWSGNSSFATLTVGGNDVGFSSLVWSCVISANGFNSGQTDRVNCIEAENKARLYMLDSTQSGLRAKLKDAYVKIIKRGRSSVKGFQLFVTGYSPFFNADTTACDQATFNLYASVLTHNDGRLVWLTQRLRAELNDLVAMLNGVILGAVQDANSQLGGNQVHFVDVVGAFSGHRWCEGDTKEPDGSNADTYFLLSNWADKESTTSRKPARRDIPLKARQGTSGCDNLGPNPDPAVVQSCWLEQAIAADPNGPAAQAYGQSNSVGAINSNTLAVNGLTPTWLIQTFHPRTNGMVAYRDAILNAMRQNGLNVR